MPDERDDDVQDQPVDEGADTAQDTPDADEDNNP